MSSAHIIALIAENTSALAKAKAARAEQAKAFDYQIATLEKQDYDLNIRLQLAEADEAFYPVSHEEGTKLKWVSNSNPTTYSVAIVKKDGILEVKRVVDNRRLIHDTAMCECKPCRDIRDYLSLPVPPWPVRPPLVKTFYKTEADWIDSLSGVGGGFLKVTAPSISNNALKNLCRAPLKMRTDAGRLEELENRFPGAKMVLTTDRQQLEIESMNSPYPSANQFRIYSKTTDEIRKNFSEFGSGMKPSLMAEWKSLYIDLSHLF